MKLTNYEIYNNANKLLALNINNIIMPIKIGFFLSKNIQILAAAAQEIENARIKIARELGQPSEKEGSYIISPELMTRAEQELNDLFEIEQELNIHIFKLNDFNNIELTYQQLSTILFMIEE